jgi:hypothetical protein
MNIFFIAGIWERPRKAITDPFWKKVFILSKNLSSRKPRMDSHRVGNLVVLDINFSRFPSR